MNEATYTMGTEEMVRHMVRNLPDWYEMTLTPHDMSILIRALAAQIGFIELDDDEADDAASMFSSIAETLNVEGV